MKFYFSWRAAKSSCGESYEVDFSIFLGFLMFKKNIKMSGNN